MNVDEYNPSWQEDGQGIGDVGGEPNLEDDTQWDTNAWSDDSQAREDFINGPASGCLAEAGAPPDTGTYILGSIDGTCQWIDTTVCS